MATQPQPPARSARAAKGRGRHRHNVRTPATNNAASTGHQTSANRVGSNGHTRITAPYPARNSERHRNPPAPRECPQAKTPSTVPNDRARGQTGAHGQCDVAEETEQLIRVLREHGLRERPTPAAVTFCQPGPVRAVLADEGAGCLSLIRRHPQLPRNNEDRRGPPRESPLRASDVAPAAPPAPREAGTRRRYARAPARR